MSAIWDTNDRIHIPVVLSAKHDPEKTNNIKCEEGESNPHAFRR